MKAKAVIRFLFVIVIIFNLFSGTNDYIVGGDLAIVTFLFFIVEFAFVLFQVLEGINELNGRNLNANVLRFSAILYNAITIVFGFFLLSLGRSWSLFKYWFIVQELVALLILYFDVKVFYRKIVAE